MDGRRGVWWAGAALVVLLLAAAWWFGGGSEQDGVGVPAPSPGDSAVERKTPVERSAVGPEAAAQGMARESVALDVPVSVAQSGVADAEAGEQLAIRAVDENGEAVPNLGIEVRHGVNLRQRRAARTDSDGWARVPLAKLVANEAGQVSVVLDIAVGPAATFDAARSVPMVGEHVLVLPPLAQVALEVHGADEDVRVKGQCGVVQRHNPLGFGSTPWQTLTRAVPIQGERTHFWVVAESGPLEAFVAFPGENFASRAEFDAPPADETLFLDLELQRAPLRFRGRALDATGAPLVDTHLSLRLNIAAAGDRRPYWQNPKPPYTRGIDGVETDATGHFGFALGADWSGFAPALFLGVEGAAHGFARVDLPPLEAGERDLGDLQLAAPPIAAGHVVDRQGVAIEGADVLVFPEEERWGVSGGVVLRARTGADGAFVVPGPEPRGDLRLVARAPGYRDTKIDVDLPLAWNYRFELVATGRIAGQLVADPGVDVALLRTRVQLQGSDASRSWRSADVALDGAFAFEDLDEGLYSLEVTDRAQSVVVALADVETSKDAGSDPRLNPLDLGPHLGSFTLRATGPEGADVRGVWIGVAARGTDGRDAALELNTYQTHDAGWRITARPGSFDAMLGAPGYRYETLRAVAQDHTVELRPAPLLPMRIADLELPLPNGVRVEFYLGVNFAGNKAQGQALPMVDGVVLASIPTRGSYHVSIHFLDDLDPEGGGISTAASNGPFQLDPDALPEALVLIPFGGFEKALEQARAR